MIRSLFQASLRTALVMLAFVIVGTGLLAFTFSNTAEKIKQNEEAAKLKLIDEILPRNLYDNHLLTSTVKVPPSIELGTEESATAYIAMLNGKPSAVVFEVTAPDGYSGKIKLLLAILANGEIVGVRVVAHKETPGLGDYIEINKDKHESKWIRIFDRKSLSEPRPEEWKVRKDGGKFDYMAGATITPRAVVKAVYKALNYYNTHPDVFFSKTARRSK